MIMKGGTSDDARTDQDVIEATAALKGMLGIGGASTALVGTPAAATDTAVGGDAAVAVQVDRAPQEEGAPNQAKGKKANKKKKNKQGNKGSEAQSTTTAATIDKKVEDPADKAAESASQARPTAQKKKRNPKKTKESENYAWSAFQSSPDASKLPIPAFVSPSGDKERVDPTLVQAATPIQLNPPDEKLASTPASPTIDPTPSNDPTTVGVVTEPPAESNDAVAREGSTDEPRPLEDLPADVPESKTGVNLAAALAAAPPPVPAPEDSFSKLPTQSAPIMSPPHQHVMPNYGMPQMYPFHQQQQPRFHMPPAGSPSYPRMPVPPPPPPPGYITIQVQVPPVLMHGRQMIVTSPAGYPVQVVVPDGIPPGMIIPVHVPAGPPMHMMPPPHPSSYGRYYNPAAPPR